MDRYYAANYDGEVGIENSQEIKFYELNEDGSVLQNGTTVESVVRLAMGRLEYLNGKFPCRENSIAITKLQEALMWLEERTKDRIKRGVEGKHIA